MNVPTVFRNNCKKYSALYLKYWLALDVFILKSEESDHCYMKMLKWQAPLLFYKMLCMAIN